VLCLGYRRWFIIDSCLCPETKKPIALSYLQGLGVDASRDVIGILITHWHSDHIAGAYELLKACSKAKLHCSSALMSREAISIASLYKKDIFSNTDIEIREFSQIIKFLFETKDRERLVLVKNRHAFFDYRQEVSTRLVALSPSDVATTQAIAKLATLKIKEGDQRVRNIVPESENLNAVALHFTFGNLSIVLGADLEETGNPQTGWSAIFNSNIISELSLPVASLFKVSHHGSQTGHHDKIWQELLTEKPLSITTPYSRSHLPKTENIIRLKALSSCFLVTRDSKVSKKIKRDPMVERELKAIVKEKRTLNDKMGHIQIRIPLDGEFDISANEHVISYSGKTS